MQRQPSGPVNARRDCGSSSERNMFNAAFESADDQHQQSPRMPPNRRKTNSTLGSS